MIARVLFVCLASILLPAQADAQVTDPFPGLDAASVTSSETQGIRGGFFINELGIGGPLRAQSRAVELLGSEFSRAAAQGLIEAQERPSQIGITPGPGTPDDRANLSVVTGIDRDIAILTNVPPTASGAVCVSNEDVDLTRWGDPSDRELLGKLRSAAIAENGDITSSGAKDLARYYLALGFGAEAVALAPYIDSKGTRDIINAIAEILDKGQSNSSVLEGQIFCDGAVSFWAALAQPISPQHVPRDASHILNTFSGLPFHLRSHLGPLLADRLRDAGLEDMARNALNAVTRGGTQTDDSKLVSAKLGLSGTRPDLSRKELLELSRGTDETAAKALLELLQDALTREAQPDPAWVDDVPSLVRATEGTAISAELNLAGLRGLISLARFDDLRLALNEEGPGLTDISRRQLAARGLSEAAEKATDVVFLRSALGLAKIAEPQDIDRENRTSISARLVNLGLADLAAGFLPDAPTSIEERRTASQVRAAAGELSTAVSLLEPAASELPTEIGQLLAQTGETERALSSLLDGGAENAATRLAIQTGNWDWVERSGLPPASEAAQALRAAPSTDATSPQNGRLLNLAQTRREQAARLLELVESTESSDAFTN